MPLGFRKMPIIFAVVIAIIVVAIDLW